MRFSDPESHFRAVVSHTSYAIDGYALGELVEWECDVCGARSEHIDGIQRVHERWCPLADLEIDPVHGPGYDGHPHR